MKSGQILVHVAPGTISEARLRYALSLAREHEAKLNGVTVRLSPAAAVSVTIGDAQATAAICEASAANCLAAKAVFDRVTTGSMVELEWREVCGLPADAIAAEGSAADLVILGGHDREESDGALYDLQPADVIMACGTPVMVLPKHPPASFHARRILLAWKSTAQAARAAHHALPLLKQAECVVLTEIVADSDGGGYEIPAQSMAKYLGSHGVAVSIRQLHVAGDAGAQLIQAAQDNECDLIVAGAYGHSRLREWALGGVTRSLLADSTLPCILSH
jgi:nucleotide-binding universal stress UspA family protein